MSLKDLVTPHHKANTALGSNHLGVLNGWRLIKKKENLYKNSVKNNMQNKCCRGHQVTLFNVLEKRKNARVALS